MKHYLALIIVGVFALTALPRSPLLCQTKQAHRPNISADHIRGNPDAPVTLEEFGDFECPSCQNLATFLDQLVKEYHPRVRLIFRNFPLPKHQIANDAALAAEAAALQGRYWEMHDKLFQEQAAWSGTTNARLLFEVYAEALGLDLDQFRNDVGSDKVRERIESDQARAKSLGVKTAPTLFVDKREMGLNEANPEGVRKLVEAALKAKSSASEKK
jgi:protein-disulfide isomerase